MLTLTYNGTTLPNAWFAIKRLENRVRGRGSTGYRVGWHERWSVGGVAQEDTLPALSGAIASLQSVLSVNGGDLIFSTTHSLLNANTIDGVRVYSGLNHPKGHPDGIWGSGVEFAGGRYRRSYQVVFEADVYDPEGNLLSYYETIRQVKSGGPRKRHLVSLTGQPQPQTLSAFTPVVVEQAGQAVGVHTCPTPQAPLIPSLVIDTPFLLEQGTADQFGGIRDVGHPVAWRYVMEGTAAQLGVVAPVRPIIV